MSHVDTLISTGAAVISLLSWSEARRMRGLTATALGRQSYEKAETLPSIEPLDVVHVEGKTRAKLVVFNQRQNPFRVHCVKSYIYAPKPRSLLNWFRSKIGPWDWDYSSLSGAWNPKGHLDDDEHFLHETLPLTLVKDKEILLVTISDFRPEREYKFEVITSQGEASWMGSLPRGRAHLPCNFVRHIE